MSFEGALPRERTDTWDQDSGNTEGLDGAGEKSDGAQITSARILASPRLLQELPFNDVSKLEGYATF